MAPNRTRRSLRPLTGTSACSPTRAQAARKGGNRRKRVASVNSTTSCRPLCFRRRTIALFSGPPADRVPDTHNGGASSASAAHAGGGARCVPSRDSRRPLADGSPAAARSRWWLGSRADVGPRPKLELISLLPVRRLGAAGRDAVHRPNAHCGGPAGNASPSDVRYCGPPPLRWPPRRPMRLPRPGGPPASGERGEMTGLVARHGVGDPDLGWETRKPLDQVFRQNAIVLNEYHCCNNYG